MACLNCKTLIELMQRQLQELHNKEQQLIQINSTLQEAVGKLHSKGHSNWKSKYHQEVKKYQELQSSLREIVLNMSPIKEKSSSRSKYQKKSRDSHLWASQKAKVSEKLDYGHKRRSSLKSVNQMDNYMSELQQQKKYRTVSDNRKSLAYQKTATPFMI